jgi:Resolvase, N terminal domain
MSVKVCYRVGPPASIMKRRVGIYLRVSTDGQTTENQRRALEAVAARSGWEVVDFYEDAGISGSNGRGKRPGLDRLLRDATVRKINMIAAWSVDRLGPQSPAPGRLAERTAGAQLPLVSPPTGHRHDHTVWPGDVSDVRRFRRV